MFGDADSDVCRDIVLEAVAFKWKIEITVYTLNLPAATIIHNSEHPPDVKLSVLLHERVLYPVVLKQTNAIVIHTEDGKAILAGETRTGEPRAVFDTIIDIMYPFVFLACQAQLFNLLPPVVKSEDVTHLIIPIPVRKDANIGRVKDMMGSLMACEGSLLSRTSSNSTMIEGSWSMIMQVEAIVEAREPFTSESNHVVLGQGRRGAVLLELMVGKDITVVGLEKESESESHRSA